MNEAARHIQKPHCYLFYARAPEGLPAAEANRIFNEFIADRSLPLPLLHDHFIGQPGGFAIFFAESAEARDALLGQEHLTGWQVEIQPLVYAHSPSAFDEQISFTLRAYRGVNWEELRNEERPSYGNPAGEAEPAKEE